MLIERVWLNEPTCKLNIFIRKFKFLWPPQQPTMEYDSKIFQLIEERGVKLEILLIIIVVIGLSGLLGNQAKMLRKMEAIEETLREIKDKN
ncbi:hypothetical protein AWJ19_28725 [Paenibacillus sp. DMB5]|nr:hypothetical protein AWJ19_28725 [Paenibacillus sp. DMB5]